MSVTHTRDVFSTPNVSSHPARTGVAPAPESLEAFFAIPDLDSGIQTVEVQARIKLHTSTYSDLLAETETASTAKAWIAKAA